MDSYVSCIRIRGKPILPPLMTEDVKLEMNYYKQLAQAVEEKLMRLRLASEAEIAENSYNIVQEDEISKDQSVVDSPDIPLDVTTTQTTGIDNVISRTESSDNEINTEPLNDEHRRASDDDTVTNSTDVGKYMNISDSSKTDMTETISEPPKPRVPQTLDIIPIVVNILDNKKAKSLSNDEEFDERHGEVPPKLVRQGSYTLDTPSPMLLAHLEQTSEEYKPTPTTNGTNRQEWRIGQTKSEWKNTEKQKRPCLVRRHSTSGSGMSLSRRKYKLQSSCQYLRVKSVDCIQMMLSNEPAEHKICNTTKNSKANNVVEDFAVKSRKSQRCAILDSSNKIGGSFSDLNNDTLLTNGQKCHNDNNNRMTKSFEATSLDKYESEYSPKNVKPVLTTDKLLYIFKEIQKTHEQQIADLVARQEKEQFFLQQQFEQQQLMLLTEIEKSFPGVSSSLLIQTNNDTIKKFVSLPHSMENNESHNSSSPLNGSSFDSEGSASMNFHDTTRNSSFAECKINNERRRTSVSRELFPLKSNTTHVPITNGSVYTKQHVLAATIINAYARGYLVRRLMKTERVVTLKNTYKEALHCMLKLHVDAPLQLSELNFHQRLQHQCDAASINIVELFAQNAAKRMEIIAHDRQIKQARQERPTSARSSFSFATQRTLARKKFKEMGIPQMPSETTTRSCSARTRCQTWTSNAKEKRSPGVIYQGIKRSTSAGAVRKPWR